LIAAVCYRENELEFLGDFFSPAVCFFYSTFDSSIKRFVVPNVDFPVYFEGAKIAKL
jgi:hypothetical protein